MKETTDHTSEPILPPPLVKGDTIGLFAPAGPIVDEEDFTNGVKLVREMGFEVKFSNDIRRRDGYLAGPDAERAAEINSLWRDPEVKALIAVRGGYGSLRILSQLDMDLFRLQPKILVGFSDISVLHAAIYKHTGLVTFHGPMVTTLAKNESVIIQNYFATLTGRAPHSIKATGLEILSGGQARGRLCGGNLTNLLHLVATPYEVDWSNAILFIEDIGEAPYRIDRMLTHLFTAGRLQKIAGLILGNFRDCGDVELIWKRVAELFSEKNIPIWANFPAGHGANNHILPLGITVEMDSNSGVLHMHGRCTQ